MTIRRYVGRKSTPAKHPYVITLGCIGDVVSLLQYHYQPHLPACPKLIIRSLHVVSGQTVGVCVLAWPVLRNKLRESVFSLLPPVTINRHFTQLVRLIVHPDHREHGLARKMLAQAMESTDTEVLEAINLPLVPDRMFIESGMHLVQGDQRNYYYAIMANKSKRRGNSIEDRRGNSSDKMQRNVLHAAEVKPHSS